MLDVEVLVLELSSVDALAASSVAAREVSLQKTPITSPYALSHKTGNNAVEDGVSVGKRIALLSEAVVARAEADEVLHRLRNDISVPIQSQSQRAVTVRW